VYRDFLKPKSRFLNYIKDLPNLDIGVSIRRGNLLSYFPAANQSSESLISWFSRFPNTTTCYLFTDDIEFVAPIRSEVEKLGNITFYDFGDFFEKFEKWEIAFLEFCILSYKVNNVYGTPHSSFAEEAGLFGGKNNYNKITI